MSGIEGGGGGGGNVMLSMYRSCQDLFGVQM